MTELFSGPMSVRWPTERRNLVLTVLMLPLTVFLVGLFLHLSWSEILLLAVTAMLYVAILRGRLLGTAVRVDRTQFPELFAAVARCAEAMGIEAPEVFIREDVQTPVIAIGFGPPYSLIVSSYFLPHLRQDELTFLIGRELAHVAAGHTRVTSFFSTAGRDNPIGGVLLGAWLRCTEYTADRVGLLCCGSLDAALRAIVTQTFHSFAPRVDHAAFLAQQREIERDQLLRMGEWLGVSPYVSNRVHRLELFSKTELYARANGNFVAGRFRAVPAQLEPEGKAHHHYARRALAFGIDLAFVGSAISLVKHTVITSPAITLSGMNSKTAEKVVEDFGNLTVGVVNADVLTLGALLVYCAFLVALSGQTFGMIVSGVRVIGGFGERISFGRALWRYAVALASAIFVVPLIAGLIYRRPLHDWLSGTRVVPSALPQFAGRSREASV